MSVLPHQELSLAPMLDITDRHFRMMLRCLSRHIVLYTEMIPAGAVSHGKEEFLKYSPEEHPLVLQLGGAKPDELAFSARVAEKMGYDAVNINAGCPSDRVQNGAFGAVLMKNAALLSDCVKAMKDAVSIPVTVKTRLGIMEPGFYGQDFMYSFLKTLGDAGMDGVIIHARCAVLTGMSPKENRDKLPLDYPAVYQIKKDFPQLHVTINGNIKTLDEAVQHLEYVDGVMMGRAVSRNPYILASADQKIFGDADAKQITRVEAVRAMYPYIENYLAAGGQLKHITRHLQGLFAGCPGGRLFRQYLVTRHHLPGAGIPLVEEALKLVEFNEND